MLVLHRRSGIMSKSEVLIREDFINLPSGSPQQAMLAKSYSEQPTKNGGTFLAGQLECNGTMPFKVWGGDTLNSMKKYHYKILYVIFMQS